MSQLTFAKVGKHIFGAYLGQFQEFQLSMSIFHLLSAQVIIKNDLYCYALQTRAYNLDHYTLEVKKGRTGKRTAQS